MNVLSAGIRLKIPMAGGDDFVRIVAEKII
jgi:hypothetical protein